MSTGFFPRTHSVVLHDSGMKVGVDFVDAVTGAMRSHGEIHTKCGTLYETKRPWQSTLDIETSERILRQCAKDAGHAVVFFSSQACEAVTA